MRALVVHPGPNFSVADVYRGWLKGLTENGVDVRGLNLDDRLGFFAGAHLEKNGRWVQAFEPEAACRMASEGLLSACFQWWPQFVIVVSGFFVPPEHYAMLRGRGIKVVLLHTESPYEDDIQIQRHGHADLSIVNDPTNLDRFREHGPALYLPHAYDPGIHHPRQPVKGCGSDVFFVGTGYPSRIEFLERTDWTGVDLALAGNWQQLKLDSPLRPKVIHPTAVCFDNVEAQDWYASCAASFNLYRKEASETSEGWSMGPREVELAASETFYAREPRGEGDDLLPMLPTFTEPDELGDLMRWAITNPDKRREAAIKAREAVAVRTFANHAAELLRRI